MSGTNKSILTMTDVSARSDGAIRCAASIAAAHGWQLNVVFAVQDASTRGEIAQLNDTVHDAKRSADFAVRAQLRRLLGEQSSTLTPLLILADPGEALLRATAEYQPELVVLPSGCDSWRSNVLSRHVLQRLAAPLLVTSEDHVSPPTRVVVALDPAHLDAGTIKNASHWNIWFRDLVGSERRADVVTELNFVFVEGGPFDADFGTVLGPEPKTLVVVPLESLTHSALPDHVDRLMIHLMSEMKAQILFVARSHVPSPRIARTMDDEIAERRVVA